MKTWFSIKAMADVVHVRIYDEIGGYGVKASALTDEINACGNVSEIHLSIHSPGGDIFEGLAIYNALKNQCLQAGSTAAKHSASGRKKVPFQTSGKPAALV
ncbi:TPA: ATP-dependent Clp protease proteolytic subunit [Escherichia coli]